MNNTIEHIHFRKGLEIASDILPTKKYIAFRMRLKKILGVASDASLSRHANGINRTPYAKQVQIGNEFAQLGISNYKGKARKKSKQIA